MTTDARAARYTALNASIILLCVGLALYYAIYSLWLGFTLLRPMPYYDQWHFVHIDYSLYIQDKLPFELLFRQSNEHRILTTRLVLLADATWFEMRGYLPMLVSYACLGAIAWMLARAATLKSEAFLIRAALFTALLALVWSIAQWEVLGWALEVFFPMQHLFALAALAALANAVTGSDRRRYVWLALAVLCDFLIVWSSASGIFLTAPLLLLCCWLRANNRIAFIFFPIHALIVASFFVGYHPEWAPQHGMPGILPFIQALTLFPSWPFAVWGAAALSVIGCAYLIAVGTVTASITRTAWAKRPADRDMILLVSFAAFVFIEGALLAYARPYNGIQARHATLPILFTAVTVAILWRWLSLSSFASLRWGAVALAVVTTVAANSVTFEREWRDRAAFLDETMAHARAGELQEGWMKQLCPDMTEWLAGDIELLRAQKVGPFAGK